MNKSIQEVINTLEENNVRVEKIWKKKFKLCYSHSLKLNLF